MQVTSEADDVAHHLVGDDVREQAAHVGEHARVGREFGEEIMFEAGRRRLHPPQPWRGGEHPRGDLAEERVGVGHVAESVRLVAGVHHRHRTGGGRDPVEAFIEAEPDRTFSPVQQDAVRAFLAEAEGAPIHSEAVTERTYVQVRRTERVLLVESCDRSRNNLVLHRSFLTK